MAKARSLDGRLWRYGRIQSIPNLSLHNSLNLGTNFWRMLMYCCGMPYFIHCMSFVYMLIVLSFLQSYSVFLYFVYDFNNNNNNSLAMCHNDSLWTLSNAFVKGRKYNSVFKIIRETVYSRTLSVIGWRGLWYDTAKCKRTLVCYRESWWHSFAHVQITPQRKHVIIMMTDQRNCRLQLQQRLHYVSEVQHIVAQFRNGWAPLQH